MPSSEIAKSRAARKPRKPQAGATAPGDGSRPTAPRTRAHGERPGRPADVLGWVDQRTGASGFLTGMLYRKVPKGTNWFYTLGSATLFAFIVQAVTGVFLAMFYTPSATQAYASITHINNDVFLGELVHGMHKWGVEPDGDPDLPPHGRAPSSSAPTSTRASSTG